MERVAWYPMGLYEQQKARERSRRICYSLLIFCTMAGAAALTVSWLLATGRIDPDRRPLEYKVPRKLDFNTNSKYPKVISQKELSKKKNILIVPNVITEIEGVTEEIPNMNDFEENDATDDLVDELTEVTDENTLESVLEMEAFELSDKEEDNFKDSDDNDETTLDPLGDELEITTILN